MAATQGTIAHFSSSGLTMADREASIVLLLDYAERGQIRRRQRPPSISMVPRILRDHNESFFIPQLVSIGPIHRGDPKLKEFEWLKECYLDNLLNRCDDSTPKETILEACLERINDLISKIRESYAGVKKNYSDVDLAMMMVMDGCFILEFCFKHEEEDLYLPNKMQNFRIAMDLILLENQVPFFVLQALFDVALARMMVMESFTLSQVLDLYLAPYIKLFHSLLPEKNSILSNVLDKYLAPYIKRFCSLLPKENSTTNVHSDSTTNVDSDSTTNVDSDSTPSHVLGYLHKRYQPVVAESSEDEERKENILYHSIVELDGSGMKFKPHQEDEWSMTIKFQSPLFHWFWRPTLLMPTLLVDDFTELILRNFIAYEQSFPQDRYYFSSYAHAMDMLIYTQEDIAQLAKSKILASVLGSNQKAADMINKIGRNISVHDSSYTEVFKQMDKHHKGRFFPKNMTLLKRAYFNNPWNFLALFAAFILFGLTVTQTIYKIRYP